MHRAERAVADPFLSIIIPVYNEENRLPQTLDELSAFCARQPYSTEIVVVENGSETAPAGAANMPKQANLRAILSPQRQGLAVLGMLQAYGAYRLCAMWIFMRSAK
jgi:glycosyltransferase involved in cell wall biosynthesis